MYLCDFGLKSKSRCTIPSSTKASNYTMDSDKAIVEKTSILASSTSALLQS